MNDLKVSRFMRLINTIDIIGIVIILVIAFYFQFALNELPCPLCLLQRLGLLAICFGFLLNIHYQVRPSHYALSILAAIITAMTSMRQILLHIAPGDSGYGSTVFNLHMYTWVFIFSVAVIIYTVIILSIPKQYHLQNNPDKQVDSKNKLLRLVSSLAFLLFAILLIANILSLYFECGLNECPDNPSHYIISSS
ncbi:disulfide bond formation protein B [Thiotrichales bacterium 19S3-7]|nr:disulfide bond formation protein B [Thiotrichales bacterium 19S3-7]MCF6800909.1 disulfide bond formation protein B [Thiotrichales bacterium 19S3-11]